MTMPVAEFFGAIRGGDVAAIRAAIAAEPSLAASHNEQGVSAVMWACYVRQAEALTALRAAHPPLDLFEAVACGDEATASAQLAAQPALARSWSADGFTALHLAAFFSRPALAKLLLAAGADPAAEARNAMRVTPLHSAATSRAEAVVRALLEAGAPPDARQEGGYTPLMSAALNGDEGIAELLLARGADRGLRSNDGHRAADYAQEKGHAALAAKLLPSGG